MTWLRDFRGQLSWGRICALVSLIVAVVQECRSKEIAHIALWLGIATGNYTASKITEMVTNRTTIQTGGER